MSIDSEEVMDEISSKIVQLLPSLKNNKGSNLLYKYATTIEDKVDLTKIMESQKYKGIDKEKIDRLAKEADIQESIDDLLEMLD